MDIRLDKRKIESFCIFISVVLTGLMTVLGILAIADAVLDWDILPDGIQQIAMLFMWASVLVIISSFLICLMVNLSLISSNIERIADKINSHDDK